MKQISEIVGRIKTDITSTTPTQVGISRNPELTEEAKDYINKIFRRLIVVCPAWKNSSIGDATEWANGYKAELAAAMKDAGVGTGEQIKTGLAAVRQSGKPFLPAPGEFASLCIGKTDKGLSHNTAAYKNNNFDTYGQRQICHKRSEEERLAGIERIQQLKKAANLDKFQEEDEKQEIPVNIDELRRAMREKVEAVKAEMMAGKVNQQ